MKFVTTKHNIFLMWQLTFEGCWYHTSQNMAWHDRAHSVIILLHEEVNDLARRPMLGGNEFHAWWIIGTSLALWNMDQYLEQPVSSFGTYQWQSVSNITRILTHRGPVDLRKWAIFNTILMSPKSWLSQEDSDAGCEHSLVPMDS